MRRATLSIGLVLLAASVSAAEPPGRRLKVAVSIAPQVWLVDAIGGERVDVVALVAPGESPETYQPDDATVSRVLAAELYFRLGVPFENGRWFGALQAARGLEIVDLRRGIQLVTMEGRRPVAAGAGDPDPHVWLSPRLLAVQARTVAEALIRREPDQADRFRQSLARLEEELAELDRVIAERLAPHRGRAFLVVHPSWGYLADAYGLRQLAVEREGAEPSDRELTELQELAKRHRVGAIFVEPRQRSRAATALARVLGARVVELDPMATDLPAELARVASRLAESFE